MRHVQVNLQDLAELLFVSNTNDARVELTLDHIDGLMDLFHFLVHLLCKGLVLLSHGAPRGTVYLDEVDPVVMQRACAKLANAGVVCSVHRELSAAGHAPSIRYKVGSDPPRDMSDIQLIMQIDSEYIVRLSFTLVRV